MGAATKAAPPCASPCRPLGRIWPALGLAPGCVLGPPLYGRGVCVRSAPPAGRLYSEDASGGDAVEGPHCAGLGTCVRALAVRTAGGASAGGAGPGTAVDQLPGSFQFQDLSDSANGDPEDRGSPGRGRPRLFWGNCAGDSWNPGCELLLGQRRRVLTGRAVYSSKVRRLRGPLPPEQTEGRRPTASQRGLPAGSLPSVRAGPGPVPPKGRGHEAAGLLETRTSERWASFMDRPQAAASETRPWP